MFKNAAAWRAKYKRNYKFNPPVGKPCGDGPISEWKLK
jgi:hypothetical protein